MRLDFWRCEGFRFGFLLSVDLMELSRFVCLYEKLLHPFPGDQGIVGLRKFALNACFEEHDGIVLVLPIVVALEGETSDEIF